MGKGRLKRAVKSYLESESVYGCSVSLEGGSITVFGIKPQDFVRVKGILLTISDKVHNSTDYRAVNYTLRAYLKNSDGTYRSTIRNPNARQMKRNAKKLIFKASNDVEFTLTFHADGSPVIKSK